MPTSLPVVALVVLHSSLAVAAVAVAKWSCFETPQ
jgi:hypothetical protein